MFPKQYHRDSQGDDKSAENGADDAKSVQVHLNHKYLVLLKVKHHMQQQHYGSSKIFMGIFTRIY